jgi:hypothetical protein
MTSIVIDLFGKSEDEEEPKPEKAPKIELKELEKGRQLYKQVINIHGDIVTI